MSKIQPVNFNSIEDFLSFLPPNELEIVNYLRQIILGSMPICVEKLAYNIPYYYINSRVLFIWPSSVPWGKVPENGVIIGFCNGYLLNDEINFLEKNNRKQVYTKTYYHIKEIDVDLLKSYIFQAIHIDGEK